MNILVRRLAPRFTPQSACALLLALGATSPLRFVSAQSQTAGSGDYADSGSRTARAQGLQNGATLVVNTLEDKNDGACTIKHCTLREAITAANSDSNSSAISFEDGLGGTIALGSALPALSTNLALQGPGANTLSVSGEDKFRIFLVSNGKKIGPKVSIHGLTLLRGGGAAIEGGAIFNDHGTLSLSSSTLTRNAARSGGAIFNSSLGGGSANLTIRNSTLASNSASLSGGAVVNLGTGGNASLNISNSTFFGNGADSGGAVANVGVKGIASASILSSTLSGNGARFGAVLNLGVGGRASLSLGNSIFQNGSNVSSLLNQGGTVVSRGHNLSSGAAGGNAGTAPGGFLNRPGDIRNTEPALQELAPNGGPTPTMALHPSSPAINAGQTDLPSDQRGKTRPSGGADDIGAFEFEGDPKGGAALIVTTAKDTVLPDGLVSLREAIQTANSDGTDSAISFDAATFATSQTIVLNSSVFFGELNVANDGALSIDNASAHPIGISGGGTSRVFFVAGAKVSLRRLSISGGNGEGSGISGNGGAIYNDGGAVSLRQSAVSGNSALAFGGGIWTESGSVTMLESTLSGNTGDNAAGLYALRSAVEIERSTLSGNVCRSGTGGGGGAIDNNTGSTLTLRNASISGNSALLGGGILNFGTLSVQSCTLTENTATYPHSDVSGGGIYNSPGARATVDNSIIAGNMGALPDVQGDFVSEGFNLIGNPEGSSGFGASGDRLGQNANLGPLADNGGLTQTHALLEGSAALDAGQTDLSVDQRGEARSQGIATDIGAFESALRGNAMPLAAEQSVRVAADAATEITLGASDTDGDALTFEVVRQPKYGTLGPLDGNTLTYTPDPNYRAEFGPISFEFVARDASLTSAPATVVITLNARPVARNMGAGLIAGESLVLPLFATDADGDPLVCEIVSAPAHGTLSAIDGNQVTYTPNAGFIGSDGFEFIARDGSLVSNRARVSIQVEKPPVTPVAVPQSLITPFDTPKTIALMATDPEFRYSISVLPTRGILSSPSGNLDRMASNQLVYTPSPGTSGPDSFSFVVHNGPVFSSPATVSISVQPRLESPAPAGVRAQITNGQIEVHFEPVPGAAHYQIFRSQRTGSYPSTFYGRTHTSPFKDLSSPSGVRFYYVVRAVAPNGILSASSLEVSAMLP